MNLDETTSATLAVAEALDRAGIRAAVYGGLALAADGTPRETKDAGFAIVEAASTMAVDALREVGFEACSHSIPSSSEATSARRSHCWAERQ